MRVLWASWEAKSSGRGCCKKHLMFEVKKKTETEYALLQPGIAKPNQFGYVAKQRRFDVLGNKTDSSSQTSYTRLSSEATLAIAKEEQKYHLHILRSKKHFCQICELPKLD